VHQVYFECITENPMMEAQEKLLFSDVAGIAKEVRDAYIREDDNQSKGPKEYANVSGLWLRDINLGLLWSIHETQTLMAGIKPSRLTSHLENANKILLKSF
jgi:hypothetical protein